MERKGIEERKRQYISSLLSHFQEVAQTQRTRERIITALFEISKKQGNNTFITLRELEQEAGTRFGIDPWVSTAVVEKEKGRRAYRVRKEFYQAIEHVLGGRV